MCPIGGDASGQNNWSVTVIEVEKMKTNVRKRKCMVMVVRKTKVKKPVVYRDLRMLTFSIHVYDSSERLT